MAVGKQTDFPPLPGKNSKTSSSRDFIKGTQSQFSTSKTSCSIFYASTFLCKLINFYASLSLVCMGVL